MAESTAVEKQDSLDETSSEEWTIIYKKEVKFSEKLPEKTKDKKSNYPKESRGIEEALKDSDERINTKEEIDEEVEEAEEKELESDVSILSDESDPEYVTFEERRVERIEWPVEKKSVSHIKVLTSAPAPDGTVPSNALITCSVVALIMGVIIASSVVEFRGRELNSKNYEIEDNLKELARIEKELKELNDVKQALDQIRISMPEIKQLKDQLENKGSEKSILSVILDSYKDYDKLQMLQDIYKNFCFSVITINTSNSVIDKEPCKIPEVLSDMINFKNNLQKLATTSELQEPLSFNQRIFNDINKKLDSVSKSLLSEVSMVFSKFTMKIPVRLNKFRYKLHKQLCSLHSSGKVDDKFLKILIDDEFFVNNCNETNNSDPNVIDLKSNVTWKEKKDYENKKRYYEDLKKNGTKYDAKNDKDYKKNKYSKENYLYEKGYNEENLVKSKGEIKNDNDWKKNKYENKEKYFEEEKKLNKYEKNEENYNKKYTEYDFDNSFDMNKGEQNFNDKYEYNKKDYNINKKFESNKRNNEFDSNKKDQHDVYRSENKINNDHDNDDSKFITNFDKEEVVRISEEQKYKNKREYIESLEGFKGHKNVKYQKNERKDKKEKYHQNGDWQMQRGKARESLRNSDWYFVRADSRQKARSDEEVPTLPHRKCESRSQGRGDSFKRRVLRRVGRTWDFLNDKIQNYF